MADVKLVTKFVDLGSTGGQFFALYGFRNIGGTYGSFGTLSETANGSSNTTTSYLYSTSTDIKEIYWADQSTDTLYFTLDGNRSNSAFIWAKLKIGSTTFTRSTASYSYNSSTDRTTWSWATNTNPFGSTTNGTDVAIEVILDVNTGHTASISATTLTATSTSDVTYTTSNASSSQKYRLTKSSGTIASGGANGTVIDSRTGSGALTLDYSNNELPPENDNATYQLQVSGPYVSDSETESGFWINTTGQNNSFTITRQAASITAPVISSVTNNNAAAANVTATVNLSSNGSGGTLKYAQTTSNSVPASGWQTGNTFSHPRGTTRYYWASQDEDTSGTFDGGESHAVGYLTGDTSVSATNSTIANTATSASTTVSNGTSGETYAVRLEDGSTNLGTRTGNGSISFTSSLPSGGNTTTYEIFVQRPVSTGGDGSTFTQTNVTFDVARTAAPTYSINAPASINEGSAGTINVTTTNLANTTLYWDLDLSQDYSASEGTVTITSNAGSFTITPNADSATEGAETDTIRLYSDSGRTTQVATDSFTINDTSTGSGGSSSGADGTSTYGLNIYGPDGSTIVFSSNFRTVAILSSESVSLAASGGTKTYTNITDADDSSRIGVDIVSGFFSSIDQAFTITRSTANGGTITVTNNNSTARTVLITIIRLA